MRDNLISLSAFIRRYEFTCKIEKGCPFGHAVRNFYGLGLGDGDLKEIRSNTEVCFVK